MVLFEASFCVCVLVTVYILLDEDGVVRGIFLFLCVGHSVISVDEVGVISSRGNGEASFCFCVLVTV